MNEDLHTATIIWTDGESETGPPLPQEKAQAWASKRVEEMALIGKVPLQLEVRPTPQMQLL